MGTLQSTHCLSIHISECKYPVSYSHNITIVKARLCNLATFAFLRAQTNFFRSTPGRMTLSTPPHRNVDGISVGSTKDYVPVRIDLSVSTERSRGNWATTATYSSRCLATGFVVACPLLQRPCTRTSQHSPAQQNGVDAMRNRYSTLKQRDPN